MRWLSASTTGRERLADHFFRALRIIGPKTSRAITRMMSSSQIMSYSTGTRRVSSSNQFTQVLQLAEYARTVNNTHSRPGSI